eukprot:Phypoly_transcript_15177.p1 GENE.Phypoly_transcript_15177~~Phypoly_transcript_15177.p1  ORF type:complete len:225 (+),score=57.41 Phypoly_transcript_15177:90-764(+)
MLPFSTRALTPLRASFFLHRSLVPSSHLVVRTSPRLPLVSLVSHFSTSPPTPEPSAPQTQPPTQPPTDKPKHKILNKENLKVQSGKLRTFIRKYGPIGIGTYFGMYGATLAGIYGLVSSGLLGANDAISFFKMVHVDKLIDLDSLNPKAGNFAVAWILTKFTEPIRFGLTIAVTPSIYRFITGRRAAREEEEDDDDGKHEEKDKKKEDEEDADEDKKDKKKGKD